jgi:hypothetical protein
VKLEAKTAGLDRRIALDEGALFRRGDARQKRAQIAVVGERPGRGFLGAILRMFAMCASWSLRVSGVWSGVHFSPVQEADVVDRHLIATAGFGRLRGAGEAQRVVRAAIDGPTAIARIPISRTILRKRMRPPPFLSAARWRLIATDN